MTKKVRKFIGEQNAFVSWTVDTDFEQLIVISDGSKQIQFTEWGRDKKAVAKHDKEIGQLIDELIAYRTAMKAKYEEKK
jgi:hypothetical protein